MRIKSAKYEQSLRQGRTGGKLKSIRGFLLIFILVLLVWANWKIWQARENISSSVKELTKELQKVEQEKENLQSKILQSQNVDYLEKVGREELNFKKAGESVVAFPDQKVFQETESAQKIRSLWQEFFEMRKKEKEKARE